MTEKEKMMAGHLYDANYDSALLEERKSCKILCHKFNSCNYADEMAREQIIRSLMGRCGSRFVIEPSFWCDYGYNITLGENFYSNHNLVILDGARVVFGDNVFLGPNCGIYTAGHPLDFEQRNKGLEYARPVVVGDNVWFGANVVVLPGVNVGSNVTIGAGSVVNCDIPDNCVAVGNPCRVVKVL